MTRFLVLKLTRIFDIEQLSHNLRTDVKEHKVLLHVRKFVVVVQNHGDKKEPVVLDKVQFVLLSGRVAV